MVKNVGGSSVRLSSLRQDSEILVLVFASSKCPVTALYWDRFKGLRNTYRAKGMMLVIVGGNSDDSMAALASAMEKRELELPLVWDDGHILAKLFGVEATPTAVVIDRMGEILYCGRVDDAWRDEEQVKDRYLENAINAAFKGEKSKDHLDQELFKGSKLR